MAEASSAGSRQPSMALANEASQDAAPELPFSTRRPKDAKAGLSSGIKNVGKGVGAGLAGLIALPALGAKEEGPIGFAKGLGLGLAGAVALPIAGLATGVVQVGRGVFNTAEAVSENGSGKVWDEDRRIWYFYNLQEEAKEILSVSEEEYLKQMRSPAEDEGGDGGTSSSAPAAARAPPSRIVKDDTFYKALNVATTATPSEIKKAYYVRARQLHPDKNADDPNAKAKFQQLSEAYQVLSDEDLRKKYDEHGREAALENAPTLDASAFFTMIFGSDKFEPLVGEFHLAMMMSVGEDPAQMLATGGAETQRIIEIKQRRREVQLALELAKRLQPFVDGDTLGFRAAIEEEAKELCGTAFGGTLVNAIGYVYVEQAELELGFEHSVASGIGLNAIARAGHNTAAGFRVARSALKTYHVAKEVGRQAQQQQDAVAEPASASASTAGATDAAAGYSGSAAGSRSAPSGAGEEAGAQMPKFDPSSMGEHVSTLVEMLWNISVLDIEHTLRKVCFKLLKDSSVNDAVRLDRARALRELGETFCRLGCPPETGLQEFTEKIQSELGASQAAAEHRRGVAAEASEGRTDGSLDDFLQAGGQPAKAGKFEVGQQVMIGGLVSRPDLTGSVTILSQDPVSGRYAVTVDATGEMIKVKELNLQWGRAYM